jgi:hypothetical protein
MNFLGKVKYFVVFLFLIFICIYGVGSNGFYEYKLNQKKYMTEEMIKKFENDINNGVDIDIDDYVVNENKNYDNSFTTISRKISRYVDKGFEKMFKFIFKYIDSNV